MTADTSTASPSNGALARSAHEAYNTRDLEKAVRLAADDASWTNLPLDLAYHGRDGYREYLQRWLTAFPDSRTEIDNLVEGGEWVLVEFTGRGRHTGPLATPAGEIPPTGRAVDLRFCDVVRYRGGQMVEGRTYFDAATLMRQLGLDAAGAAEEAENARIARRMIDDVFNRHDPWAVLDYFAENVVDHDPEPGQRPGATGIAELLEAYFRAFPDLTIAVDELIPAGDRVTLRWTGQATHQGEFRGIPASRRPTTVTGIEIFRIERDRIVERWGKLDRLALLQQIGALPAPAPLPIPS